MEYKQLNASFIENKMLTQCMGKRVIYYDEIDSTNTAAKRFGKLPGNHGVLILAEQQNAGKGRLGRVWSSPKGSDIFMSLVLQPEIHPQNASMLTLVTALAVSQGIREVTGISCYIKWPNDVVVNKKKICGILTEMSTLNGKMECIVIGMGINVNRDYFPNDLRDTATSLILECKRMVDRTELIVSIMKYFEEYYARFERTESLQDMTEEYNSLLVNKDRMVRILGSGEDYTGTALGINEKGALLVRTQEIIQGESKSITKTVVSGEVSVRGIYGYV